MDPVHATFKNGISLNSIKVIRKVDISPQKILRCTRDLKHNQAWLSVLVLPNIGNEEKKDTLYVNVGYAFSYASITPI